MSTTPQVTLYHFPTPNGSQISAILEELKRAYPSFDYTVKRVDIANGEQKQPWFLKLNPNGRIPVLVDHTRGDFAIFETAAILLYLAQHFDKNHLFWFDPVAEPEHYSVMLQWIFYTHAGVAPMAGQASHFIHVAPDIPYAKTRYLEESKRLWGVLNGRLEGREWLAGSGKGKLSLADIKTIPWILAHKRIGIETLDEWPNLKAWVERASAREGFSAGVQVGK